MAVGCNGYSYSSSVTDTNCLYLGFYIARLPIRDAGSRAHGLQLRCLSE
ncbi:hypothetical protein [uncultured Rikenella sp.]|nr:hypothetical protein [uncultured Rikenella sp.]